MDIIFPFQTSVPGNLLKFSLQKHPLALHPKSSVREISFKIKTLSGNELSTLPAHITLDQIEITRYKKFSTLPPEDPQMPSMILEFFHQILIDEEETSTEETLQEGTVLSSASSLATPDRADEDSLFWQEAFSPEKRQLILNEIVAHHSQLHSNFQGLGHVSKQRCIVLALEHAVNFPEHAPLCVEFSRKVQTHCIAHAQIYSTSLSTIMHNVAKIWDRHMLALQRLEGAPPNFKSLDITAIIDPCQEGEPLCSIQFAISKSS